MTVRLRVDPVPGFLRQDMTVSASIETGRRDAALLVPHDALLDVEAGTAAVIVQGVFISHFFGETVISHRHRVRLPVVFIRVEIDIICQVDPRLQWCFQYIEPHYTFYS